MKAVMMTLLIAISMTAKANDIRQENVLNSKLIKSTLTGLKKEQGLKCEIVVEEDGNYSISFYEENQRSKFRAAYLCNDGRSAIFTGVISDGGATATESFKLELGAS